MNQTDSHSISSRCIALASLLGIPLLLGCPGTPTPTQRPGPVYEGSAHWAYDRAEPELMALAPDAELYTVLGAWVFEDGRLPADVGRWSFVAWSPSQQEELQVTVDHEGAIAKTTRSATSPPSHQDQPVPAGWANSTVVFASVAPHLPSNASYAVLAVFNTTSYPQAPTEAIWGINFDEGGSHLVRADGSYLGPL